VVLAFDLTFAKKLLAVHEKRILVFTLASVVSVCFAPVVAMYVVALAVVELNVAFPPALRKLMAFVESKLTCAVAIVVDVVPAFAAVTIL